jgi:CHASE2 domain-containing sensor protein
VILLAVDNAQDWLRWFADAGGAYQRLLTGGLRPPYPRYTAVIEISDRTEPLDVTLINICEQRLFLSRLLTVVAAADPAAIVIDKFFSPAACRTKPEGTTALTTVVASLLEQRIPIVVGVNIVNRTLQPTLPFPRGNNTGHSVREAAIATYGGDNRRVPLVWRDMKDTNGRATDILSLSLAGALSRSPTLLEDNGRLARFHARNVAPYAAFLPIESYAPFSFSALRVMCGASASPSTDWRTCQSPDDKALRNLRGRVVVIGENTLGMDRHATVLGEIPGVELQANYIEAVLDDALYQPLPWWVLYLFTIAVFMIVELIIMSGTRWTWLLTILVVCAAYFVCYVVVSLTGVYLNPGFGIAAALVAKFADAMRRRLLSTNVSMTHALESN